MPNMSQYNWKKNTRDGGPEVKKEIREGGREK